MRVTVYRANCGQGAPEVGPLPGGSERPTKIELSNEDVLECMRSCSTLWRQSQLTIPVVLQTALPLVQRSLGKVK